MTHSHTMRLANMYIRKTVMCCCCSTTVPAEILALGDLGDATLEDAAACLGDAGNTGFRCACAAAAEAFKSGLAGGTALEPLALVGLGENNAVLEVGLPGSLTVKDASPTAALAEMEGSPTDWAPWATGVVAAELSVDDTSAASIDGSGWNMTGADGDGVM
jgi:hypothetical protein